jgi:hypothetical protein
MKTCIFSFFKLFILTSLISACTLSISSHLTLDDFSFLERGMNYEQVVERLGEPQDSIVGSLAFVTYIYELETGDPVYLGFYSQANYLDSVYLFNYEGEAQKWLIPSTFDFPSGIQRSITLNDFDGLVAGECSFWDVYNQVGSPNDLVMFEGAHYSIIYFLNDGARVALNAHGGLGCKKGLDTHRIHLAGIGHC